MRKATVNKQRKRDAIRTDTGKCFHRPRAGSITIADCGVSGRPVKIAMHYRQSLCTRCWPERKKRPVVAPKVTADQVVAARDHLRMLVDELT